MGKVRIIGGIHRSRILQFKDEVNALRPTPDRVRETLFNWLGQDLTGKTCLDLFAGSGALGFEAVSRNAKQVTLVEKDSIASKDLHKNQELLNAVNLEIVHRNAISYLDHCNKKFDVIFLDPPYDSDLLQQSLSIIKSDVALANNGMIYIEYKTLPDLTGYSVLKSSKAGAIHFAILIRE